jgi:3-deoxy-D-manno-octulosonate 8-phosphate phosphatase (KDO 8-P phosphatase)
MPKDGVEEIKEVVDVVLQKRGGEGAVREMIEYILKKEGLFNRYLDYWRV